MQQASYFPTQPASGTQPLYQLKAGKCHLSKLQNGKFQVTPDKRRGQISLTRGSDGLLHFKWTSLANGAVEDDRIVMPEDATFKKVKTGRETAQDRVYMLKLKGNDVPFMYWMQDIDTTKDDEKVREINNSLNGPRVQSVSNGTAPWMLGNQGNTATTTSSSGASGSSTNIGGLDFANLLSAFNVRPASSTNPPPATPVQATSSVPPVASPTPQHGANALSIDDIRRAMEGRPTNETPSLSEILNAEEIISTGVLSDPAVQQELLSTLPPEHQTVQTLEATLRSAQVQQSAHSLTNALQQTENFQSIMSNFQFDPSAGFTQLNQGDGVGAFIASLQAANPPNSSSQQESKEEENKMDESQ